MSKNSEHSFVYIDVHKLMKILADYSRITIYHDTKIPYSIAQFQLFDYLDEDKYYL